MNSIETLNRSDRIIKAINNLLENYGICSFGMILTEERVELGYCYQKNGFFVFVDHGGEEVKRPLMSFYNDRFMDGLLRRVYNSLGDKYEHPIKLLQYNEKELVYTICNPSCEKFSSIYSLKGNNYYIICSNGKSVPIDLEYGFFEFIDRPLYIFLTFHDFNEIKDDGIIDNRYEEYYSPRDVFYNKKNCELFNNISVINYKKNIIISGVTPYCTIILDENMTELYRKEESAVFCEIGENAFLIFEKSQIAYNIDSQDEKKLDGLKEYDNYDVYFNYLIRFRITSYAKEEIIKENERKVQCVECIPKHDVSYVIIYDSNLDIVKELYVPGICNGIVKKEGELLVWSNIGGEFSFDFYYDINRQNYKKYDAITNKIYTIADIVEKQISNNLMIIENLDYMKANLYSAFFNQDEFDDEDEIFNCKIKIKQDNKWLFLSEEVYTSIVSKCFKYRDISVWPTYLLAIKNRKHQEYDLFADDIKLVNNGKYSKEAIKICDEGRRIVFSNNEKYGIIGEGKIIVPSVHDSIDYYHDYKLDKSIYIIRDEKCYGIIDNNGNILLQCNYAMIKCYYDWYDNLYILVSSDNMNYSWGCCDKEGLYIDKMAFPDENSIIRPSWESRESYEDNEIYVQVNYNLQTGKFSEDEKRFRYE